LGDVDREEEFEEVGEEGEAEVIRDSILRGVD